MATSVDSLIVKMNCEEIVLPNATLVKVESPVEGGTYYQVIPSTSTEIPTTTIPIHDHNVDDITGLEEKVEEIINDMNLTPGSGGDTAAPAEHNHDIEDILYLADELDLKADVEHNHEITEINNLETTLNTKADIDHTHEINDIVGLKDELIGKADVDHEHNINIANLSLDMTNVNHEHTSDQITDSIKEYIHNESISWIKDGSNTNTLTFSCNEANLNLIVTVLEDTIEKEKIENIIYEENSNIYSEYLMITIKTNIIEFIPIFYEGTYTVKIVGTLNSTSSVNYTYTCTVLQDGTEMDERLITGKAVENYILTQNYAPRYHTHFEIESKIEELIDMFFPIGGIYLNQMESEPSWMDTNKWQKLANANIANTNFHCWLRTK